MAQELSAAIKIKENAGSSSRYNTEGWFSRVMYNLDEKYFLSASYRRDASSHFHPDHRWGNFYSVGGAWIASKEDWFEVSWIDMLKVKASWGQQGNDAIGDYRYTDGSYTCDASDIDSFTSELMVQRRIEFWGEGINYFAYKRLGLPVTRSYDGTNWLSSQRLNTKAGYTAPWMNYVVPEYERDSNPSVILGPDPSGTIIAE